MRRMPLFHGHPTSNRTNGAGQMSGGCINVGSMNCGTSVRCGELV